MFDLVKTQEWDPNAVLRGVIAQRFRQARALHGFEQCEAANRLELSQSTLNAIEAAKEEPTTAVLIKASLVFAVAVDFLVGLSDQDETDPTTLDRFATLRHLRHLMTRQAASVVDATLTELHSAAPQAAHARDLVNASARVIAAFECEPSLPIGLNATAAGRALVAAVATLTGIAQVAREWLERQDRLAERAVAKAAEQLSRSTTFQQSEALTEQS